MFKTFLYISTCAALAIGSTPAAFADGGKAYTWVSKRFVSGTGNDADWVLVGSNDQSDAYVGDASPKARLPILCFMPGKRPEPAGYQSTFTNFNAFYHGWSGGEVGLTPPVQVSSITSLQVANRICARHFCKKARIASHHDNKVGGWNFGASLSNDSWNLAAMRAANKEQRMIVHIRDQTANPWNP